MKKPRFIGRSAELQLLKDLWGKACEGHPQVVNLVADTGVGKTRLVQAFYEWLITDSEQVEGIESQHYWPNDLGAGRQRLVNPPLERFNSFDLKNGHIPWLWWGMYWTDADGENECGLVRFHEFIDVHLGMLELQQDAYRRDFVSVRDALKDEAIGLVAGLIPGGSQVLSVFDLAKKLHANRKERHEATKGLANQDKSRQEALAESVINRLKIVFNRRQKGISQVPLVLFLDDVHFATDISRDGFSLQFLDRLMRQAGQERWPLLVLSTHWRGPWQAHRNGPALKEGKPWRRIMMELDADQSLKTPEIHTLKLKNIPREGLRSVVLDQLPGLNREDQDKILDQVDNVRWLVEVLNALSDSAENFESQDRKCPLNDHGHRRLERLLKTRGYLEVIRQRLEGDAMQDVRAVLGATAWHAHELEFVSSLASAFGEELVRQGALPSIEIDPSQQVLQVLLRALDPSALLEGQVEDNLLPSLVRFPERGYLEISKELFDPKYLPSLRLALGQEVLKWMQGQSDKPPRWEKLGNTRQQRAFLGIAIEVLGRLQPQLSEKQCEELEVAKKILLRRLKNGKISEGELQEQLQEARQELLDEAIEPRLTDAAQWQAVAMAELVYILYQEDDVRAWKIAFELAEHPQLSAALRSIDLAASYRLVRCWEEKADCWPKARNLLSDLIKRQAALVEAQDTSSRLRRLARFLRRLAVLEKQAGDKEQARVTYHRCLVIHERLVSEYGETPQRLEDLACSLRDLVVIDYNCGYVDKAKEGCQRLLDIYSQVQDELGECPELLEGNSFALLIKGRINQNENEYESSRISYQRCLEIRKNLIERLGESPELIRNLSNVYLIIADLDKDEGAIDKARAGYQRSISLHENMIVKFGELPERLLSLSIALERLAKLNKEADYTDHALACYQRNLEIQERMILAFGENPERIKNMKRTLSHLETLAGTIISLADRDRAAGETEKARAGYKCGLAIWEKCLTELGGTSERLQRITAPLLRLSDLDRSDGDAHQARAGYQRSVEVWESLLEKFGETPARLRNLTIALERLGYQYWYVGSSDLAQESYQRCLAIRQRLIAEFGESPQRLLDLTKTLEYLANLQREAGNVDQAREIFQKSLDIQRRLLVEFGESDERLRAIAKTQKRLADLIITIDP